MTYPKDVRIASSCVSRVRGLSTNKSQNTCFSYLDIHSSNKSIPTRTNVCRIKTDLCSLWNSRWASFEQSTGQKSRKIVDPRAVLRSLLEFFTLVNDLHRSFSEWYSRCPPIVAFSIRLHEVFRLRQEPRGSGRLDCNDWRHDILWWRRGTCFRAGREGSAHIIFAGTSFLEDVIQFSSQNATTSLPATNKPFKT